MINYAKAPFCGCKHPEFMKHSDCLPDKTRDRIAAYDREQQGLL